MIAPPPTAEVAIVRANGAANLIEMRPVETRAASVAAREIAASRMLDTADALLPVLWLVATLALLCALVVGQRRFRLERRQAREARIGGHDVLLTEHLGPAVAGVRRPVVFVPRWVLALDEGSQQLLLAHEVEHVKQRDTWLLLFGAVTAALTPWNPMVWWTVRRLRLAVEQDCDARVLAVHPGIRRYVDLLLTAASRHGLAARLLAAHFGEHTSDLVRRIEAMTSRKSIPWRRMTVTSFIAAALVAAACEAPRPDPVAPLIVPRPAAVEQQTPANAAHSAEFSEQRQRCMARPGPGCQIAAIVESSDGKVMARYAGEIPVAQLPDGGIAKVNVEHDSCGVGTCSLIWITLKPDASLRNVIRHDATFEPKRDRSAEFQAGEVEVKAESRTALKRADMDGTPVVGELRSGGNTLARIIERDSGAAGRLTVVRRSPWLQGIGNGAMPNIIIQSSSGAELRRFVADPARTYTTSPIADISPDDISAIEVMKGQLGCAPLGCPLVRVWLKAGREAAYRKP
jgi:beta-lactamase regulating signal transducer with metallopeptidase domain